MTLTLDLSPDLETRLHDAARRHGQKPEAFAAAALAATLRQFAPASAPSANCDNCPQGPVANGLGALNKEATRLTLEEFDAALNELAAIGADIPVEDESITHSREDIYLDHD